MTATFIGIDLAWKSDRNPTGAVALRGDRTGAELLNVSPPLKSIDEVLGYVRSHATDDTVVAIDAPLIIVNESGQRACETAALFDLPKIIKYKKGKLPDKRAGLETLREYIAGLAKSDPPLRTTRSLNELLATDLSQLIGRGLKDHEDTLDALFCAYLAFYFWFWGWEQNELFGDMVFGYILNPKLLPGGIRPKHVDLTKGPVAGRIPRGA